MQQQKKNRNKKVADQRVRTEHESTSTRSRRAIPLNHSVNWIRPFFIHAFCTIVLRNCLMNLTLLWAYLPCIGESSKYFFFGVKNGSLSKKSHKKWEFFSKLPFLTPLEKTLFSSCISNAFNLNFDSSQLFP